MTDRTKRDQIEDEASLWAARLEGGGMTDADRAGLAVWLTADPENREVLATYRQLSADIDAHFESPRVQRRRWPGVTAVMAAAAAVVLLLSVWLGRSHDFSTQVAERHVATLADGSRVELNAQTELKVSFRRDERRVQLTHGEALFNVARDSARPFVVETPTGAVRVTGTVFNVRAAHPAAVGAGEGERVEVTVLEGTVRVQAAAAPVAAEAVLTPGHQASMSNAHVTVRELAAGAAQDIAAWRQGQAVFDDTPLADAMERFAAYQARKITVDAAAADLRLGGRYSLDDLDGLLDSIERFLPVRVMRGDTVRIVAAEPGK